MRVNAEKVGREAEFDEELDPVLRRVEPRHPREGAIREGIPSRHWRARLTGGPRRVITFEAGRGWGSAPRGLAVEAGETRPEGANHVCFGEGAIVIGGRHHRSGFANLDDHNRLDAVHEGRSRFAQPLDSLGVAARAVVWISPDPLNR